MVGVDGIGLKFALEETGWVKSIFLFFFLNLPRYLDMINGGIGIKYYVL